ncbi:MAG: adenylate kinase [Oscillospiraceae bacterium]|nr:adenylate kinase [Oscillospiraceae bacterium]
MNRVLVIGCPGSGKSTLAKALHEKTGLPLFHLDMLYWNEDKTTVSDEVFMERLSRVLAETCWIIDGNYASTLDLRMQFCDTALFLDYPVELCLAGIASRIGQARTDMPWVETEADPEFLEFVKSYPALIRPNVLALLNKYTDKEIHIFRNRQEADEFLSRI